MARKHKIIISIFFLCFFSILFYALKKADDYGKSPMIGKQIPAFKLISLDGDSLNNQEFTNEVVVINFFASWCVTCLAEHEHLKELAKNVRLYGIAWRDENTKQYILEHGNPYHKIGIDKKGDIGIEFGITGVPQTFIIDKDGKIIFAYPGNLTKDIINDQIIPIIRANK